MILKIYHKLENIAEDHFVVANSKIIYLPSGETQKLRIFLVDGTILDIWISVTGRYSYHWDRRINQKGIYRFDNAPHKKWSKIHTFPDHFHFGEESIVKESFISKSLKKA